MIIDSHCHLHFPGLIEQVPQIIKNAEIAGLTYMVTISTILSQAPEIQNLMDTYPQVYGTTGVHPCDAYDDENLYQAIVETAKHHKIVGIGETGLDYFHKKVDPAIQKRCFETQVQVANDLNLPLIIHTREAEADTVAILKQATRPGILHCFTSSYDMAKQALDMGFFISFSGILTYSSANDLRETARQIPKDRVLIETDAPYLLPKSKQTEYKAPNQPAFIRATCQKLSEIWGWSFEDTAHQTTKNCLQVFNKLPIIAQS